MLTLVSIVVGLVLHCWVPRSVADLINSVVVTRIADASTVMIIIPILLRLADMLYSWMVVIALIVARVTLLLNRLLHLLHLLHLWLLIVHLVWLVVLWILEFRRNGATKYILWLC